MDTLAWIWIWIWTCSWELPFLIYRSTEMRCGFFLMPHITYDIGIHKRRHDLDRILALAGSLHHQWDPAAD